MAIPDSALSDESTKLDKSRKISQLARCAAVFGVRTILVYRDGKNDADRSLLVTILQYMETPQFLRRQLFPKMSSLKFAGVLHPLAIASHDITPDPRDVKTGDIREGIAVSVRGARYVDVGINKMIRVSGARRDGRVTVRFRSGYPDLDAEIIDRDQIPRYWGYTVRERGSIGQILREWGDGVIIATRTGKTASASRLGRYAGRNVLVVFGSPQRDVLQIAGGKIQAADMMQLNFFPRQNTRTVRLEEAVWGTFSILNMYGSGHE